MQQCYEYLKDGRAVPCLPVDLACAAEICLHHISKIQSAPTRSPAPSPKPGRIEQQSIFHHVVSVYSANPMKEIRHEGIHCRSSNRISQLTNVTTIPVMRKEDKATITTPIPATTTRESVLACLHDHALLIKLSPQVEDFKLTNGNAQMSAEYSVTDRKPIGKTTYELKISNNNEGCDTDTSAHPPLGLLKIWSRWRVMQGEKGWTLSEDIRLEANRAIVGKVRSSLAETHKEQHAKLLQQAGEMVM